jgi:hypothetical protein
LRIAQAASRISISMNRLRQSWNIKFQYRIAIQTSASKNKWKWFFKKFELKLLRRKKMCFKLSFTWTFCFLIFILWKEVCIEAQNAYRAQWKAYAETFLFQPFDFLLHTIKFYVSSIWASMCQVPLRKCRLHVHIIV